MACNGETDFQFLAEHSLDILCRASLDRTLVYLSPSSVHVLGWKPEEMTGRPASEFIHPEDLPVLGAALASEQHSVVIRMRKKDGSLAWMENRAHLVRDSVTTEPLEWVVIMRDITERKLLEEKLSALAHTDSLTGLANRRAFDGALEHEWKRTLREGTQISLLLLDIDHFKRFNDQFGHQVGDDCLRAVAGATARSVRCTDLVARYGGEEIAVILIGTGSGGAVDVAEKIRCAIEQLELAHDFSTANRSRITVSIGVATALARNGGTMRMPESLLQAADAALYKAKHLGRNRVATALLMASKDCVSVD